MFDDKETYLVQGDFPYTFFGAAILGALADQALGLALNQNRKE